ncbi:MAG: NAD(P)H-hydrate dehydratase [Chitinophagaceae bacterium]|nr:NAD(P)H-hydrate dehydratase [Chitinophagaceae bacterium]
MKIYRAEQIRQWDQYTITHEPVASIDLMERAAQACLEWMEQEGLLTSFPPVFIFCGKGNNGGDGLALARLLLSRKIPTSTYILEFGNLGTPDFQTNLARLHPLNGHIHFLQEESQFPTIPIGTLVVDALYGSGMNRPLEGLSAALVHHLNTSNCPIISIDIPSGLSVDQSSKGNTAIWATHTLCFQTLKPALLVPENGLYVGQVTVLDIGLHPGFEETTTPAFTLVTLKIASGLLKKRDRYAHKGNFGHASLLAGSTGSMGAAVLAARACLRSGAGKLTCYVPATGLDILQIAVPEAMVRVSGSGNEIEGYYPLADHQGLGIGPAIGLGEKQRDLFRQVCNTHLRPMVIDADALTLLGKYPELWEFVPRDSILTPHPGEWERLFGKTANDFERIAKTREVAERRQMNIVLKGHYSFIALPDGSAWFNSTGNPGMATAGSGDVLTGILTALLAQGYTSGEATLLGVFLHGLAGDMALETGSEPSLIASDLIDHIGAAYSLLTSPDEGIIEL